MTTRLPMENYDDSYLLYLLQQGNKTAESIIIERYIKLVIYFSGMYYIPGNDNDDVIQEGLIGLLEAARNYNAQKNVSFNSFASLCISRKIISAIRTATRTKNSFLNSYISLEYTDIPESRLNPEEIVINNENIDFIKKKIEMSLSKHEKNVLSCFLKNMSYNEIAKKLGSNEKSVDNALSRSRRKLNILLQN